MRFDIDKVTTGTWFDFFKSEVDDDGNVKYFDPEKNAGKIQIRPIDPETLESIQKNTRTEHEKFINNKKTRQLERVVWHTQTDQQKKAEREAIWDYAIPSFQGMLDGKDNEIPVTLENKMKLMAIPVFARCVSRCLELAGTYEESEKKTKAKN